MSHPDDITAAEAALAEPITAHSLAGATVDTDRRPPKVVISARIDPATSEALLAEAAKLHINPSTLAAQLVAEGLRQRSDEPAEIVTVRVADLHRAIDAAITQAA